MPNDKSKIELQKLEMITWLTFDCHAEADDEAIQDWLNALEATARREALQEAAKAMCEHCDDGIEVLWRIGHPYHRIKWSGLSKPYALPCSGEQDTCCSAHEIYELLAAAENGGEDG